MVSLGLGGIFHVFETFRHRPSLPSDCLTDRTTMQGQASCPLNSEHPGCLAKGAQLDAGRGLHKPVIHFSPSHPKPNCPPKKNYRGSKAPLWRRRGSVSGSAPGVLEAAAMCLHRDAATGRGASFLGGLGPVTKKGL